MKRRLEQRERGETGQGEGRDNMIKPELRCFNHSLSLQPVKPPNFLMFSIMSTHLIDNGFHPGGLFFYLPKFLVPPRDYELCFATCEMPLHNTPFLHGSFFIHFPHTALHRQHLTPVDCSSLLSLCILFQDVYLPLLSQFTLIRLAFYMFQEIP